MYVNDIEYKDFAGQAHLLLISLVPRVYYPNPQTGSLDQDLFWEGKKEGRPSGRPVGYFNVMWL